MILLLRASLEFSPGVLNLGRCLVRWWNGPGRGKCDFLSGKISPAKRTTGGWVCHCVLTAQRGAAAAGLGSIISAAVKRVAGENCTELLGKSELQHFRDQCRSLHGCCLSNVMTVL